VDIYELLLNLSIILLVGFLFGKLAEHVNLPDITGHIVAGVLIGPYVLSLISVEALEPLEVVTKLVLGVIAFQIGTELFFPVISKNAKPVLAITLVHSLVTLGVVFLGIYLLSGQLWLAFALSGLAVASAPAPVVEIIKKLRAKGPVKRTVIPVVGLLDMVAVILFGLTSSIALSLLNDGDLTFGTALVEPILEVGLSIVAGIAMGVVLALVSRLFIEREKRSERYLAYLVLSLAFILGSVWLAEETQLSVILIPLSMGMTFTNFVDKETFKIQDKALDNFIGPFLILFFTIAGLSLSPTVVLTAGGLAAAFILLRLLGKLGGSFFGSSLTRCPTNVRRYTGVCLLPQAGITIGMLATLSAVLPSEETQIIQAIVLSSILFFQIVGPVLMQKALIRSGEAREQPEAE